MHSTNRIEPKFSIITVTYNAGKVLEETLQSVANQTYRQVEYILVDGGSKDNTLSIAEKYRSHIHQLISEPDKGLYDAMNKGIRLATGDYDTLQAIVNTLSSEQLPDVIYGETAIVDKHRRFLHMRKKSTPKQLNWKSFKEGMLVCHQAFLASRALAQKETYDLGYRFSADFDWCIRIMKRAKTLHNTHTTLINYLNEGMTTQNHRASLKERFRIMVKHYGWISTLWHHFLFAIRALK